MFSPPPHFEKPPYFTNKHRGLIDKCEDVRAKLWIQCAKNTCLGFCGEWVGSNVRISVVNIEIPSANDGNSVRRKLGHGDLLQSNV